ncbi:MAG: cytochrome C biosynthesis protein [Mucinivorans sp.]
MKLEIKITTLFLLLLLAGGCSAARVITGAKVVDSLPLVVPDVVGVTIPAICAPLNFTIGAPGERFQVEFSVKGRVELIVESATAEVSIPQDQWHAMLGGALGDSLVVRVLARCSGEWRSYSPFSIYVSSVPMDRYLVYRLIDPGYAMWGKMGIYERDLSSFNERTLIDNSVTEGGCMNCHTFSNHSPRRMMLHLRNTYPGTVILNDGVARKISLRQGEMCSEGIYPAWSNDGNFIAYSVNEILQAFPLSGDKAVEVFDRQSDLVVYDVRRGEVITDTAIFGSQWRETFPEWSADGRWLYFSRAAAVDSCSKDGVVERSRYDVCRVAFDGRRGSFGAVEVVYRAGDAQKSASFIKCSPDGRYLVFTLSDYGNFSIWHQESDLYLMDLVSGSVRAIDEVNSSCAESYHSFSSSGGWLVFSSRAIDGLYTRPYIVAFDASTGGFGKPFLLPAPNADYYQQEMCSYNIPQFVSDRVCSAELVRAACAAVE